MLCAAVTVFVVTVARTGITIDCGAIANVIPGDFNWDGRLDLLVQVDEAKIHTRTGTYTLSERRIQKEEKGEKERQ
jgi:hypothetical protein